MDLSDCGVGRRNRIVTLDLGGGTDLRMRELGLRPGAVVVVTQDVGRQGRVVALGVERFALDQATCARITVEAAS